MIPSAGVFMVLTLIVAPGVLTNASSVLALNTANRFGRVVDRSRALAEELRQLAPTDPLHPIRVQQLARLRVRALLLMRAQSASYAALGCFVATAMFAIIGALLAQAGLPLTQAMGALALGTGAVATGCILTATTLLVRETRLALTGLREDLSPFGEPLPAELRP